MSGDEPTLRDRIAEALLSEVPGERQGGINAVFLGAGAAAVMEAVVAPELERRDERIAELEAVIGAGVQHELDLVSQRDEARAEVERLRAAPEFSQLLVDELIETVAGWTGDDGTNSMGVTVEVRRLLAKYAPASAPSGNTETGTEGT